MEPTTNQIIVNVILSSFAYAYILHQMKIFLLKTGEPFSDWKYEVNYDVPYYDRPDGWTQEKAMESKLKNELNTSATTIGFCFFILILSIFILYNYVEFESYPETGVIILCVGWCFVWLVQTLRECYKRYVTRQSAKEGGYFIEDFFHFLVFEAFSIAHYFSFDYDKYALLFSHINSALSYLLGSLILFKGRFSRYQLRILFILICLVLCMSGKFSILNWKF